MSDFKVEVDPKNKILNEDGDPVVEIREDVAETEKKIKSGVTEPLKSDRRNKEASRKRVERLKDFLGDDFEVQSEPEKKSSSKRKSVRFNESINVNEEDGEARAQSINTRSAYKGAVSENVIEREGEPSRRNAEDQGMTSDEDLEFYADDDDTLDIEADLMHQQLAVAYHSKRNSMLDYDNDAWDQEMVPGDANLIGNAPPKSKFEPYARRSFSDKMINEQGDEEQVSIMIPRLVPGMKMGKYDEGVITAEETDDWDEYTEEAKQMLEELKMGNGEDLPQVVKPESRERVEVHKRPPAVEPKREAKPEEKPKLSRFKAARMQKM